MNSILDILRDWLESLPVSEVEKRYALHECIRILLAGQGEEWEKIVHAACVCRDINDSGEKYTHENADGATALATLMSMLPDTPENPTQSAAEEQTP